MKDVLWKVVKRLSYIQDARCLKVKVHNDFELESLPPSQYCSSEFDTYPSSCFIVTFTPLNHKQYCS